MNNSTSAAIGLVIVALILRRQLRTRPVRQSADLRLLGLLGVLGVLALTFGVKSVTDSHPLSPATVILLAVALVVATAFGALRARTVRVWRDPAGLALRKGTAATVALWLASLAAHIGLDVWIDHTTGVGLLGPSTLYAYMAVSVGTQDLAVRRRAAVAVAG